MWPITTAASEPTQPNQIKPATSEATASGFTRRSARTKTTGAVTSAVSRDSSEPQRAAYACASRSSSSSESSRPSSAATRRRSTAASRSASEALRSGSYDTAVASVVRGDSGPVSRSVARLVLERDREADAEGAHRPVLDRHVLADDLGD